jgi:hypothetical protein
MPPIPTLDRLQEQRQEQIDFVDHLLSQVDAGDGRDLVPAERANLDAARQRLAELDEQIRPLAEFEAMRETAVLPTGPRGGGRVRPVGGPGNTPPVYGSAGAYFVDYLATLTHKNHDLASIFGARAEAAGARVRAMREADAIQRATNQVTTDTPGILPTPVVGTVLNTVDASRPLITSLGPKSMTGIPGTQFSRPHITQHTIAGKQTTEKTPMVSQQMSIDPIQFPKETYGGWVNISRQDIDWTSPTAWDILVQDLADAYAKATEIATAAKFANATGMNGPITVASNDLTGWAAALYEAAALVYTGCGRLPDRLWVALDVWSKIGPVVDTARLVFPGAADGGAGESSLARFEGNMFELDRVVVPSLPDGTAIIGNSSMAEFYEERIGLLSAVEPSILGVEVAYGGYTAFGFLEEDGFTKLTAPTIPLTTTTRSTSKSNGTTA